MESNSTATLAPTATTTIVMATICCRIGLSVKEQKWGRSGYNKDIMHVNYETTPTRPEPASDHHILEAGSTTPLIGVALVQVVETE